jgi:hypothetical protein
MAWAYSTTVNATGAASISGSTLTFASAPTGTVAAGQIVTGTGVAPYAFISADQYIWSARSFLSDGVNGPLVEDVQLLSVANLSLTQAQAAALTGISLVASGTTGGVITLTSNRTAAEVWAYYRNWISTLANFGSDDTWSYDGTTLTIGGWTIAGLQYLTTGRVVTSTADRGTGT